MTWLRQLFCFHPLEVDEAWNIWEGPAAHRCGLCGCVDWL